LIILSADKKRDALKGDNTHWHWNTKHKNQQLQKMAQNAKPLITLTHRGGKHFTK